MSKFCIDKCISGGKVITRDKNELRAVRLKLMDEILEFIAQKAGDEKPRTYSKFHELRQKLANEFGCNP